MILDLSLRIVELCVEFMGKVIVMVRPKVETPVGHITCMEKLHIVAPLGIDADRAISLSLTRVVETGGICQGTPSRGGQKPRGKYCI